MYTATNTYGISSLSFANSLRKTEYPAKIRGNSTRFGFNGKEKDNETYGTGNVYDFGARIYDSRLGRWMSVDPSWAKYPGISTYNFSFNSPLMFNDPDGKDAIITVAPATPSEQRKGNGGTITYNTVVHIYGANASDAYAAQLQTQWDNMNTTADVIIDKQKWIVQVNVTYVYNQTLENAIQATRTNCTTFPNTSDYVDNCENNTGVLDGHNIMEVDNTISDIEMRGVAQGMTLNRNSAKVRVQDPAIGVHETGHFLGFAERYNPDLAFINSHPGFGPGRPGDPTPSDFMTNTPSGVGPINFNAVHFYDLAMEAVLLSRKQAYTRVFRGAVDATVGGRAPEPYVDNDVSPNEPIDTVVEKQSTVSNPR